MEPAQSTLLGCAPGQLERQKNDGQRVAYDERRGSWTWPGCEGQKATVEVYSDAEFVALYCNDKPVGKKRTKKFRAIFKLPYRPGTLKAVALDKSGNALGETTLQTAGQKTRAAPRPGENDLARRRSITLFYSHHADRCGRHLETVRQRKGSSGNRRTGCLTGPRQCCNTDR